MNRKGMSFSPEALEALKAYAWPGNARELQNAIERAVVTGRPPTIERGDLPRYVSSDEEPIAAPAGRTLKEVEAAHIHRILEETDWNISRAATVLEVDRGTLYHKIKKYGLERPGRHDG